MKRITVLLLLLPACLLLRAQDFTPVPAQIPDNQVSLLDYGGVPDGITANTAAFSKAISALAKQGGGHLRVPEGVYLTGPIKLRSGIDLHVERGAVILFSPDKREFLEKGKVRPAITASKCQDVSISGEGIIDGNGAWWRAVKRGKVSDTEWNEFLKKGGTVMDGGTLWYAYGLKHYPDIADNYLEQERLRTHLVRFTDCQRVSVTGVTLQNAPKFHLVPQHCTDVTIENVTVRCPWNAQNGDGIDIMQCQRVYIARCTVDVGDDGICLKAGAGEKALKDGPCKDIVIEYNTVFHAHGGFVIGSEFSGGMENITVRHNTFCGTDTGLRFKSAPERGGKTSNIRIHDTVMTDIRDQAIVFQTDYADRPAGYEDNQAAQTRNFLPEFTDIDITRVTCRGCSVAIKAAGTEETIHGIKISNSVFFWTDAPTQISATPGVTLENVRLESFPD